MRGILVVMLVPVLLLVSLVACAAQPVSISDLPVFPGTEVLERGQNSLADNVLDAMQKSAADQGLAARFSLYSIPADTTWPAVVLFFEEELDTEDWTAEPALRKDGESFSSIGWVRGGPNGQQSLVVNYVAQVEEQGAFLLIGLLSK